MLLKYTSISTKVIIYFNHKPDPDTSTMSVYVVVHCLDMQLHNIFASCGTQHSYSVNEECPYSRVQYKHKSLK